MKLARGKNALGGNSQLWLLGYEVTGGGGKKNGLIGGTERQRREEELKKKNWKRKKNRIEGWKRL